VGGRGAWGGTGVLGRPDGLEEEMTRREAVDSAGRREAVMPREPNGSNSSEESYIARKAGKCISSCLCGIEKIQTYAVRHD
jgi:hypothetical protein